MDDREVVWAMAKGIHDGRCTARDCHASPRAYDDCIRFYTDHAELALGALREVGFGLVAHRTGAKHDE